MLSMNADSSTKCTSFHIYLQFAASSFELQGSQRVKKVAAHSLEITVPLTPCTITALKVVNFHLILVSSGKGVKEL